MSDLFIIFVVVAKLRFALSHDAYEFVMYVCLFELSCSLQLGFKAIEEVPCPL